MIAFSCHDLPSFMDRKLVVGKFCIQVCHHAPQLHLQHLDLSVCWMQGHTVLVATVHLESEMAERDRRREQMACIHKWLAEKQLCVMLVTQRDAA